MSHKIQEDVTQYASGAVTREVAVEKGPGRTHGGHTTQHTEVKHDGKLVDDVERVYRDEHGRVATGAAPLPLGVQDHHGGHHPVVQAYQEGATPHGAAYHERLDVVGDKKAKKEKIKKDNQPNIPVMARGTDYTHHGHGTHVDRDVGVHDTRHGSHSTHVDRDVGVHDTRHGTHGTHVDRDVGVDTHHGTHTSGHGAIVDHHGKHHVVGPTGGIVDHHGRETSNIVDMAKQINSGVLPANAQVKAELQPLQQHLLEREMTAPNTQTEQAMRNARKLVEAVETTIDTKNSGDKFQRLVDAAARVATRTTPTAAGAALGKETRDFVELVKDLVIELGRSRSFRKALLDMFTLLKDIIGSEVDLGGGDVVHSTFVEGHHKEVGKHIKDRTTGAIKDMPDHHKRDISAHLKTLLLELRDHRESAGAIKKTLRLGTLLNRELSAHISHAQVDPDVREVQELALAIIQSFAVGVDIRSYLHHIQKAIEFIQNEVVVREYLYECSEFISRSLEHPERIESENYIHEAEALVRKGRCLATLAKQHPIILQVADEASALVYAIKSDEQLSEIKYHASKVAESMTYTDRQGKSHIDMDIVATMRNELVPFLLDRIREVQVPGFRVENEGKFEYLEVHDLYVTLGDILPDRIRVKTTNDTDLTLENLHAPVTSSSYIKFFMEGLRPEFKDFYFGFKRTGKVIKLKDEGRADLRIKGKGVNIYITFRLEMDSEHRAMLGKHNVDLELGPIDLDITQAEHKKMLNMASSMFAPRIKTAVETSLKKKLEEIGGEWATIINKRVLSAVPSVGSIGSRVKDGLQSQTHALGARTGSHHDKHHHGDKHSSHSTHPVTGAPAETHAHIHT